MFTTYTAPRQISVFPFWRPKPLTSVTVSPCTPMPVSASRTSSSLNGLMMAMTSFMEIPRLGPFTQLQTGRRWAWPRKVLPPRRLPRESMDSSRVPTRRQQAYRFGKNDGFVRGTGPTAAGLCAQRSTKFAQKMVSALDPGGFAARSEHLPLKGREPLAKCDCPALKGGEPALGLDPRVVQAKPDVSDLAQLWITETGNSRFRLAVGRGSRSPPHPSPLGEGGDCGSLGAKCPASGGVTQADQ